MMMNVYLSKKAGGVKAEGTFDPKTKSVIIKAGSHVSEVVSDNKNFGGAEKIVKLRNENCKNFITQKDLKFTSPTTAANFVTGMSTNGLLAWKNAEGKTLKELV